VSETSSISAGIAARYATAVFELAKEEQSLAAIETDVDALDALMAESGDFRELIASPIYSRADQGAATGAIAARMELSPVMTSLLGLMAAKRRLFALPHLVRGLRDLIAREKGEVTADVTAAKALTKAQSDRLSKPLKASVGKDVKINLAVEESLIGGLVVKVGSRMIDTSIASKLANLQNAMKEVG